MRKDYDRLLRPDSLAEVIGLKEQKVLLETVISAARKQHQPVGHILLSGPAGTGKTTLAEVVASEMGSPYWTTTGTNLATQLQDAKALFAEILPTVEGGGIIFVDEIHRVANLTQDTLLPWIERNELSLRFHAPEKGFTVEHEGTNRMLRNKLHGKKQGDWVAIEGQTKPFTFIGATTRAGMLQGPFRSRFRLQLSLDFYDDSEMFKLLRRSAWLLELGISDAAIWEISTRAKGIPRIGNNHMWYAQQWQIAHDNKYIDKQESETIMQQLGLDSMGLERRDRKLLKYLIDLDRPAGATTLCSYLSEDKYTLENVIEPYLIRKKLVAKTPRGRIVTRKGLAHMEEAT